MLGDGGLTMSLQGRVALFVTCLADVVRPRVAEAAAKLLEDAGFSVEVPAQGCCGQPSYNSGDLGGARRIARAQIAAFEGFEAVVAPSGSCAAMVKRHYPDLFPDGSEDRRRAEDLAARIHELTSFLAARGAGGAIRARFAGRVTYHDACSGLRELGIKAAPRALLAKVDGLTLTEMSDAEACCGFGGTFCVKYPQISARILDEKLTDIEACGAACVVTGDVGCLMNIEGRLHRSGVATPVYHVAEVLAGMTDDEA
jgi:L-lactate dehydrogenase complex protein LldE